jgi:hypothetical protein
VNVALRKILDHYACLRPCKSYPGVRSRYTDIDLVIVRENTEDLYAGIEYEAGTPEAELVIGPFSAVPFSRIEARVASGSGLPPFFSITSVPACWTSQSNSTPVASRTRRVASVSSGPVPSPGMSVTRCAKAP